MALRDWHAWQIGVIWAIGIGITWLVGHLGVTAVTAKGPPDSAHVSAGGAPLWTTGVTMLILAVLLIITIRWVRGRILDQ